MKVFIVEAYGGPQSTDGAISHFTVQAATAEGAIDVVRRSSAGIRYGRFEVVEETKELEAEEAGIIAEDNGPYRQP